jgi:hypothetical protein
MKPLHELPLRPHLAPQQEQTLEQLKQALDQESLADERGWRSRINCGRLLSQIRDRVGRNFEFWIKENYRHSRRTAYRNITRYEQWCRISKGRSLESVSLDELDTDDTECATVAQTNLDATNRSETISANSSNPDPPPNGNLTAHAASTAQTTTGVLDTPSDRTTPTIRRRARSTNGQEIYCIRNVEAFGGGLIRLVDDMTTAFAYRRSPEAEQLRQDIYACMKQFWELEKKWAHSRGRQPQATSRARRLAMKDEANAPVPEIARAAWTDRERFEEVERIFSDLQQLVVELAGAAGGKHVPLEEFEIQLKNARSLVAQAKPTHLCPVCGGEMGDCGLCRGEGWVSAHTLSLQAQGTLTRSQPQQEEVAAPAALDDSELL